MQIRPYGDNKNIILLFGVHLVAQDALPFPFSPALYITQAARPDKAAMKMDGPHLTDSAEDCG